jgi:hypothetical protein
MDKEGSFTKPAMCPSCPSLLVHGGNHQKGSMKWSTNCLFVLLSSLLLSKERSVDLKIVSFVYSHMYIFLNWIKLYHHKCIFIVKRSAHMSTWLCTY